MKKVTALLVVLTLAFTAVLAVGCQKQGSGKDITFDDNGNIVASEEGTVVKFTSYTEGEAEKVYIDLMKAFNEKYKDYNIKAVYSGGSANGYEGVTQTRLDSNECQDIVLVSDEYYKKWASRGLLADLDPFIHSSNPTLNFESDIADMSQGAVGRYLYDVETATSDGPNAHYYGLPKGSGSTVIYYNKDYMKAANITEISVYEENLEAYNNGAADAYGKTKADKNISGTVPAKGYFSLGGKYYFNNKIAMSWDECASLAKRLQSVNSNCDYGFITSWWFNYAFSVGGNCIQYLSSSDPTYTGGYYTFTLADSTVNYKAKEAITVNGTDYKAGDIVDYEDKFYITDELAAKCDVLPSQRRAFAEYMSLAGKVGENHYHAALNGKSGITDAFYQLVPYRMGATPAEAIEANNNLMKNNAGSDNATLAENVRFGDMQVIENKGISANPNKFSTDGRFGYFINGRTAMLVDIRANVTQARMIEDFDWDVAPMLVYKEYDEQGNVTVSGNEGAHSGSTAWGMWSRSSVKNAAYLFIKFACGEEGQRILAQSGAILPNQKTLAREIMQADLDAGLKPMNAEIFAKGAEYQTPGDWWFLKDGDWIDGNGCWSIYLNKTVREYKATLTNFYAHSDYKDTFDRLLKYTLAK